MRNCNRAVLRIIFGRRFSAFEAFALMSAAGLSIIQRGRNLLIWIAVVLAVAAINALVEWAFPDIDGDDA